MYLGTNIVYIVFVSEKKIEAYYQNSILPLLLVPNNVQQRNLN